MRQRTTVKSVNAHDCHLSIVANGQIVGITQNGEGTYQAFLPKGTQFEIRIAYMGFDACRYKLYVDNIRVIEKDGKEGSGVLSYLKMDVHDNWQNALSNPHKWVFDGGTSEIELRVYPAYLVGKTRGLKDSDEEKTSNPQEINYKIETDFSSLEEITLVLREEEKFSFLS